jgi:hypothetical protein
VQGGYDNNGDCDQDSDSSWIDCLHPFTSISF